MRRKNSLSDSKTEYLEEPRKGKSENGSKSKTQMVRVIGVGAEGPESCPPDSIEALRESGARFHVAPWQPSFKWLAEMGFPCEPLIAAGEGGTRSHRAIPDGAALIVPLDLTPNGKRAEERQSRAEALESLVQVVDRLLGPGGCPWDREQTHESLKRHLLEETYEVLDAIDSGSKEKLKEELGDLLLQPLMHAQMSREAGGFAIEDVANTVREKLLRRHPHVFGPLSAEDAEAVLKNWDRIKQQEGTFVVAETENEPAGAKSILEGVPKTLPALQRAFEISKRASRMGFEWPNVDAVFDKMEEEKGELKEALQQKDSRREEEEIGDLLFTTVNVARWAGVEPEEALRKMLARFVERFQYMEREANAPLSELSPEKWDELWEDSKRAR